MVRARALQTESALPPRLSSVEALGGAAPSFRLTWTTSDDVSVLVQRRVRGRVAWLTLSGWLPPNVLEFTDEAVVVDTVYEYRLRGRDTSRIQTTPSDIVSTESA